MCTLYASNLYLFVSMPCILYRIDCITQNKHEAETHTQLKKRISNKMERQSGRKIKYKTPTQIHSNYKTNQQQQITVGSTKCK